MFFIRRKPCGKDANKAFCYRIVHKNIYKLHKIKYLTDIFYQYI